MNRLRSLLMLLVFALSQTAIASTDKSLDRLFNALDLENNMNAMIKTTVDMQLQANPTLEPIRDEFNQFMREAMAWEAIEKDLRAVYAKSFTETEILELAKFYESPVGKKAVSEMPRLFNEGAMIGQRRAQERLPAFLKAIEPKLKKIRESAKTAKRGA